MQVYSTKHLKTACLSDMLRIASFALTHNDAAAAMPKSHIETKYNFKFHPLAFLLKLFSNLTNALSSSINKRDL
jgi:hypothetical protein